jgi:hypothetical protein
LARGLRAGKKTAADGTLTSSPLQSTTPTTRTDPTAEPAARDRLNDSVTAGQRVYRASGSRGKCVNAIRGYQKRRRVRTTVPEPADRKVPELLKRDLTVDAPNRRYVGDITFR